MTRLDAIRGRLKVNGFNFTEAGIDDVAWLVELIGSLQKAANDLLCSHAPIHWYVNVKPLEAALARLEELDA